MTWKPVVEEGKISIVKTMKTLTLNLRAEEMDVLDVLAVEADMSKTQVLRQALRLYQLINARIKSGETLTFSGDKERVALFVGAGWDVTP